MILNIPNCSCTMSAVPSSITMSSLAPITYEYAKDGYIYFSSGYGNEIIGKYDILSIETPKIEPIIATAPPESPEPKLNAISCPGCGSGRVKATNISGIVECEYCGRQFTLSY